jgi:amidase
MARSVADAAILLGVLEGAAPDPGDAATKRCTPPANRDYTPHLRRDGLRGARIGIPRAFFYAQATAPGTTEPRGGLSPEQLTVMAAAIDVLRAQGATIVDPADIPSIIDPDPGNNFMRRGICAGADEGRGKDEHCSVVLKYGMKRDFNAWLATLGRAAPVRSLTMLREYNKANAARGTLKYGQAALDISDEMDVERDRARYEADRARDLALTATHGIDEAMKAHKLDALLFPGASGAAIAARPGYPTVMVPFGMIPNAPTPPLPEGFAARPIPYGVSFTGMACSEPRLLELAYAFEQATRRRVPPPSAP